MKRALVLVLLVAACSGTSEQPEVRPSATPSATAEPTATPTPTTTPAAAATASAPPTVIGPAGTAVPRRFTPTSATFVSNQTGWVLGSAPCPGGKGSCDAIVRTRDGGRTWRAIPAPATSPDELATLRFANTRDGFITGTQLWATHDGGATWTVVSGRPGVSALEAAAGRVWLTGPRGLESAPARGGAFIRHGPAVATLTLHGSTVFATTRDRTPRLLVGTFGRPFANRATPCQADDEAVVGARTSKDLLLVCAGSAGAGQQPKTAWISSNGGWTWNRVADPDPSTGTQVFLTAASAFVIDHQQVGVSRDRGRTWQTALRGDDGINEGGFSSAALGFAIGFFDGRVAMKLSHDDGRSWTIAAF